MAPSKPRKKLHPDHTTAESHTSIVVVGCLGILSIAARITQIYWYTDNPTELTIFILWKISIRKTEDHVPEI